MKRIFIVDDDLTILEIPNRILEFEAYEVKVTSSAGEGPAKIENDFFNLALWRQNFLKSVCSPFANCVEIS